MASPQPTASAHRPSRRTRAFLLRGVVQLVAPQPIFAMMLAWTVVTCCIPATSWADPPKATAPADEVSSLWETAVNYFKYQDFDKAVERIAALLYPVNRLDLRRELKAREYLGASYWWQGKRDAAFDEFTALLVRVPQTRLEPAQYPPKMIDDFEARRKRLIDTGVIKGDSVLIDPNPQVPNVEGAPPLGLVFFPFGVGQFANREPTKGWLMLAGQAILGGVSAGYYLHNRDLGRVGPRPLANDVTQIAIGAAFWTLAAWGIWDAYSSYRTQWPDK